MGEEDTKDSQFGYLVLITPFQRHGVPFSRKHPERMWRPQQPFHFPVLRILT